MRYSFMALFLTLSFLSRAQGNFDVKHYRFEIGLTDESDEIEGKATIRLQLLEAADKIALDFGAFTGGSGLKVKKISLGNGEETSLTSTVEIAQIGGFDRSKLLIGYPSKQPAGEQTITIWYGGKPKDGLIISRNKFKQRTFFADNWPTRAHCWIPCNDQPGDKASFEFLVTAPSKYSVISNGTKISEKAVMGNRKLTHWKEDTELPTKVMVIGVAQFVVKKYADSPSNIPVTAWIYPQDSTNGFKDYSAAPDILKFFSSYIGPYPYNKLANVQSTTIFGGMENASAIFYTENSVNGKSNVVDLLAHEIAHQWFGDMVSERDFSHLWLSEGFATYLTNVYLQQKRGEGAMRDRLEEDREKVVAFARNSKNAVVDTTANYMELLNANSYQKGGWILHMLRDEVGDKTFQKILQTYYAQYKGGNANTRDFEAVVEKVADRELSWFFDQWLYRPGVPVLEMSTKIEDGKFHFYVKQLQDKPYRFNLEIALVTEDNTYLKERFTIYDKDSEFTVPVKGTRVSLSIDPGVKLLYDGNEKKKVK